MRQWNIRVPEELYRAYSLWASQMRTSMQALGRHVLEGGLRRPLPGSPEEGIEELRELVADLGRRLARLEALAEGRY